MEKQEPKAGQALVATVTQSNGTFQKSHPAVLEPSAPVLKSPARCIPFTLQNGWGSPQHWGSPSSLPRPRIAYSGVWPPRNTGIWNCSQGARLRLPHGRCRGREGWGGLGACVHLSSAPSVHTGLTGWSGDFIRNTTAWAA